MSGGWGYATEDAGPAEPYSTRTFYTVAILLFVCWGASASLACFTVAQCTHTYYANYSFVPNLVALASAVAMFLIARRNTLKGKLAYLQKVQYIHYASVVGCLTGLVLIIFVSGCKNRSNTCKAFLQASCAKKREGGWLDKKTEALYEVTFWVNVAIACLLALQLIILCFAIDVIRQTKDYANSNVGYGVGAYYYGSGTGIQNPLTYSTPGQSTYPTRPAGEAAVQEDININIRNANEANASTAVGSRGGRNTSDSSRLPPLPGSSPPPAPVSASTRSTPSGTNSTSSAPRININIENINKADAKADVKGQAERKRMLNLLKDLKHDVEGLSHREDKSENQSSSMDIKLPPPNNPILLMPQPRLPPPLPPPPPRPTTSAPPDIGFRY